MAEQGAPSALSISQTTAVLENAPVAIYVSTVDTRELLYANSMAKELFPQVDLAQGATCYQAVGFDQPCPFCQADRLERSKLFVRKFRHPGSQKTYQLSGKLIDWDGRQAHIEYMLDVTQAEREEEQSQVIREKLLNTFSSIPCGLCVYQYDGEKIRPVLHNPAFYEIMGYSGAHMRAVEQETNYLGVHPEDLMLLQQKVGETLRSNGVMQHIYRVWNDGKHEYRWIRLDGSVKAQEDGTQLLYGVYSDVSEQQRLERELTSANERMQAVIQAIPGGVAIYKVSDIFETLYCSDGVPELSGYSPEEYQAEAKRNAASLVYHEDTAMVISKVRRVVENHQDADFEFRKQHRDGHIVWIRAQIKWIGEEDGCPLLHCIFHNISDLKQARQELDHLVNSIPGGIASYRVEGGRFIPTFYSDGVMALSGHTREEYEQLVQGDALNIVYESDRARVQAAAQAAVKSGEVLDISYRMRHQDGHLIWIHLNGRRMGPLSESMWFYAVFTGMSAQTRLFQSIANEMADGIYVIDRDNYDLLYANEAKPLFQGDGRRERVGQKCYRALHGLEAPCDFCTLHSHAPDGKEHEMAVAGSGRLYSTRFRETDWNGIPAYVKYVQDVTEEVRTREEKERLEQYFQTVLKHLPGGVAVVRFEQDGRMTPEFLSDGFASMTGMTLDEAWRLYRRDALAGVHPEDREALRARMSDLLASGETHIECVYRLQKGGGGYIWVKNTLTLIPGGGGESRVYAGYHDITKERAEQELLRQQFKDLILQHYRSPGPNALIVGHCSITQNRILEILDHTDSNLLGTFGSAREDFFTGIAGLIVDPDERQQFMDTYLNAPTLAAFADNKTELVLQCFIQLPREPLGRYVEFRVHLVEAPDTGDVTGILTVTDVTEQTLSERVLHQLSVASYDLVADVDLWDDRYTILNGDLYNGHMPRQGCYSAKIADVLDRQVLPKDRKHVEAVLEPSYMQERLRRDGSYSVAFSMVGEKGEVLTKSLAVTATDLRLGRVCLARTDITDSVREQQGLLNVIAYTFELLALIHVDVGGVLLYTRQTVLENLPPLTMDSYEDAIGRLVEFYHPARASEELEQQFRLETMLARLADKPSGYDFVLPFQTEEGVRYKQINVLWGDGNHRTVCMVRADVTDMLAAERRTKLALEKALELAEKANRAKSDFLSSMSHDIRTPMNAIMGMTTLAIAHLDERERVGDCLRKISYSSKYLLSLINDILDMSKIERDKITLNRMQISLPDLMEQLSDMMTPQAKAAGLELDLRMKGVEHPCFFGDSLRINQILINLLGNAVKFTPEGGRVECTVEELPPVRHTDRVRYRFRVRDTGVGMSEDFLAQIFEPFTRHRNATRVEGTGLGLSITKGLVDLMEGEITVESRLHQGTVFQVDLEFEAAPDARKLHPARTKRSVRPREKSFAGCRFLIAEDNAINSEILCELLQMDGAQSVVKTDGKQAVQAFLDAAPGTYDAILMDIQMPEMNGYEATRAIRRASRDDAHTIPIIAMTANAFSEDMQAAKDAGMTAHVAKPIDVGVLQDTLWQVLGR